MGCHDYQAGDTLAREVGDPGAKAYQCAGGLGVMIEPNGYVSDFDAPETSSTQLTAGLISAKIIATLKQEGRVVPRRVDCGTNTDVQNGDVLLCHVTLPSGQTVVLDASVRGRGRNFNVILK
jgi:hypothetical protein